MKKLIFTLCFFSLTFSDFSLKLENLNSENNKCKDLIQKEEYINLLDKKIYLKDEQLKLNVIKFDKEKNKLIEELNLKQKKYEALFNKNQMLLQEIKQEIITRTIEQFQKMKVKKSAPILDGLIVEGEVQKAMLLFVKLKKSTGTKILEKMEADNSSILMKELLNFKEQ
jgi:hypothetical protein